MSKEFQVIPEPEKFEDLHTMAETRNLHPEDQELRKHGYRIHARPRKGEAVWKSPLGHYYLGHAEALKEARQPQP